MKAVLSAILILLAAPLALAQLNEQCKSRVDNFVSLYQRYRPKFVGN